ncbi:hypothetical protein [uncultured Dysosmobacter sp.]|uniref:hypothetical protein n=1 Tax=uncultured Dysosmobacter sp. TaxID=2591384 RepID=UPI00262CB197|nr:hypothetical protein [uncultured Dysosmobacter sp.]
MASNHTQHYSLSQWQATDEVVRTDFNADNAKIDAALHGLEENKPGRIQHIKTVPAPGSGSSFTVSLDDIDWGQWETVSVFFKCPLYSTIDEHSVNVTMNGGAITCVNTGGYNTLLLHSAVGPTELVFLPGHDSAAFIHALTFGGTSELTYSDSPFSQLTSLTFTRGARSYSGPLTFPAGAEVIIRGIK